MLRRNVYEGVASLVSKSPGKSAQIAKIDMLAGFAEICQGEPDSRMYDWFGFILRLFVLACRCWLQ